MGLLDGLLGQQPGLLGELPPWMNLKTGNSPVLPDWLQQITMFPPQAPQQAQDAALPPNAQPAMLSPQQPQQQMGEPRQSIWTPPDSFPGSPPVNPQAPQMQPPGVGALAQAQPQAQPRQMGGPPLGAPAPQAPAFGGPVGGGIGDAFSGFLDMFAGGNAKRAGTTAALAKMGVDPQVAEAMARDKSLMALVGPTMVGGGLTGDIREYEYAKKQGFAGSFEQWMQKKRATSGEYGMQPVYGTRVNPQTGKQETVIMQLGKNGDMIESRKPDGIEFSPGIEKVDLGTEWGLYDKRAGVIVGRVSKDVQGKEAAEERGKAQGQAQVSLPNVVATAGRTLKQIEEIEKHPGLPTATGLSGVIDPRNYIAGTDAANFEVRRKQLLGGTFLEAYNTLKGGGAITEVEGQKAQDAIARMSRAQSEFEFRAALTEYKDIVRTGVERAKLKANGGGALPATSAASETAPTPSAASASIPAGAVDMLKKDPKLAPQFDAKYGPGSAAKILGGN